MTDLTTLESFEAAAKAKLSQSAYDYYAGGAGDEITLRENQAAFERLRIWPRVLRDVRRRDTSTTVLALPVSMPVLVAPTALHGFAHPEAEIATARGVGAAGTLLTLSTLSNAPLEDVAKAAAGPLWFQMYVFKDRGATRDMLQRAEAAGFKAVVITVDFPYSGWRQRDFKNRLAFPEGMRLPNVPAGAPTSATEADRSALTTLVTASLDAGLTWKDIAWTRSVSNLPVVVKGVLRADDAELAVEHGVDGIIVSNHGGRQLDTVPAGIDALPGVARAVEGRAEVYVDGGVRRGTDVVKALALGARAVFVGRPVLWGLAAAGESGVAAVLEFFRREFELALSLCGATSPDEITPDLVR